VTTRSSKRVGSRLWALPVGAFIGIVLAACGGGASQSPPAQSLAPIKLSFGTAPGITGGALAAIADDQGLWAKFGIDVENVGFTSGGPLVTAIAAGQLDVGYIGNGAMWGPATGLGTLLVPSEVSLETFIFAQPNAGVATLADLRGHTVATPEGSAGDLLLLLALQRANIAASDIQKVNMDPPTLVSAFSAGQVDAASIWTPPYAEIRKSIPDVVTLAGNRDYPDVKFFGGIIANNDLVKNQPEALVRVLKVFIAANDFRKEHLDETVKITAAYTGLPEDTLADAADNVQFLSSVEFHDATSSGDVYDWASGLIGLQVEAGKLPSVPDPKTYINVDLYDQAFKEMQSGG
jgi:sulfonate transport system substrate-binding protein